MSWKIPNLQLIVFLICPIFLVIMEDTYIYMDCFKHFFFSKIQPIIYHKRYLENLLTGKGIIQIYFW